MAERPKHNKTALKAQREALASYRKFLPILQLKKMQLQIVLRQLDAVIEEKRGSLQAAKEQVRPWARYLTEPTVEIGDFLQIQGVRTETDNIAGVDFPVFREVVFNDIPYSLFATPAWLDPAVAALRRLVVLREELKALLRKAILIREELRATTQRCNLFEKKLIPELRENIRRIRIFLGDEETAAVGRAKLAKARIEAQESHPR